MLNKLSAFCLSFGLLGSACVVVDDDDATTATTQSSASTTSSSTSTSSDTDDSASTTSSTSSTSDTTSSSTTDETTSEGSTAGSTGGGFANCGWGATGSADVPMGYVCGGDGDDPDGGFDIACPEGLTEGAECGDLTGVGCCDAAGDAWFCADPDGNDPPQLFTESCAA